MSRRTVAIIGSDFLPSSRPPALRIKFFAEHLPALGWDPVVITCDPSRYDWTIDPDMAALLTAPVEVVRTGAISLEIARRAGIGDIGMRSLVPHWNALRRLSRERRVDLVFLPVPPYVPMVLGRFARARLGIPYVIDYIDPWVTEYYWKLPRSERPRKWFAAYWLSRILEPFALNGVGHITGVSKRTVDDVTKRHSWMKEKDGTEIPYGAEPGDFDTVRAHPRKNPLFSRGDGLLHVCSVGRGGVDLFPVLRAVFAAVAEGKAANLDAFRRLRLHFVGTSYATHPGPERPIQDLARQFGLGDIVSETPSRLSYLDAIQILLDADALLAVGSEERHYTASKIFPYILSGRPVVAVFHHESSVPAILRETGCREAVTFLGPDDLPGKAGEIRAALQESLVPRPSRPDAAERMRPYTARAMTVRLVAVFDRVAEAR